MYVYMYVCANLSPASSASNHFITETLLKAQSGLYRVLDPIRNCYPFWFRDWIRIRNPFVYMSARMYVYPLTVSLLSPYCYLRQACILRSFHYRNAFLSINLCLSKKCFFVNGHSRYWLVFLKLADIRWQPKSIDDFKFSILNKIINSTECLSL